MKKNIFLFILLLFSFVSWSQEKDTTLNTLNILNIHAKKKFIVKGRINDNTFINTQNYYAFYDDIFYHTNEIELPIEIYVWQNDEGKGNYEDTPFNNEVLKKTIDVVNRFCSEVIAASFKPFPNLLDYETTNIRFRLDHIYFVKNEKCWLKGGKTSYTEGKFLNHIADSLHPESSNHLKIHITGAQSTHTGFSTFPSNDFNHEHFIVTFNKDRTTKFAGDKPMDRAWAFGMHLAHEFGHNFDLYHT